MWGKVKIIIAAITCCCLILNIIRLADENFHYAQINGDAKDIYRSAKEMPASEITEASSSLMPGNNAADKILKPEIRALRTEFDNQDIIGYLEISGTTISYPVVQHSNNEFYLTRDLYKSENSAGSIFLDFENDITKEDKNSIIYGHNMKRDIMFHSIRNYEDPEFYKQHKYINFDTLYDSFVYEIFSFYTPNTDFDYISVNFASSGSFEELIDGIFQRSKYNTGVSVTADDRILSLSTCANTSDNMRMVISAKLISINGVDYDMDYVGK